MQRYFFLRGVVVLSLIALACAGIWETLNWYFVSDPDRRLVVFLPDESSPEPQSAILAKFEGEDLNSCVDDVIFKDLADAGYPRVARIHSCYSLKEGIRLGGKGRERVVTKIENNIREMRRMLNDGLGEEESAYDRTSFVYPPIDIRLPASQNKPSRYLLAIPEQWSVGGSSATVNPLLWSDYKFDVSKEDLLSKVFPASSNLEDNSPEELSALAEKWERAAMNIRLMKKEIKALSDIQAIQKEAIKLGQDIAGGVTLVLDLGRSQIQTSAASIIRRQIGDDLSQSGWPARERERIMNGLCEERRKANPPDLNTSSETVETPPLVDCKDLVSVRDVDPLFEARREEWITHKLENEDRYGDLLEQEVSAVFKRFSDTAYRVVQSRIDEFGVSEAVVDRGQGTRVIVSVPGSSDPEEIERKATQAGQLRIMFVDHEYLDVLSGKRREHPGIITVTPSGSIGLRHLSSSQLHAALTVLKKIDNAMPLGQKRFPKIEGDQIIVKILRPWNRDRILAWFDDEGYPLRKSGIDEDQSGTEEWIVMDPENPAKSLQSASIISLREKWDNQLRSTSGPQGLRAGDMDLAPQVPYISYAVPVMALMRSNSPDGLAELMELRGYASVDAWDSLYDRVIIDAPSLPKEAWTKLHHEVLRQSIPLDPQDQKSWEDAWEKALPSFPTDNRDLVYGILQNALQKGELSFRSLESGRFYPEIRRLRTGREQIIRLVPIRDETGIYGGHTASTSAEAGFLQEGNVQITSRPIVLFSLSTETPSGSDQSLPPRPYTNSAAERFSILTARHLGRSISTMLDGKIVSVASIEGIISDRGQITGRFSQKEVDDIVSVLNAGSLQGQLEVVGRSVKGPNLGEENVYYGSRAALIGVVIVFLFIIFFYRSAGVIASVCLAFNFLLLLALLQTIGFTLTLPGIAGMALTLSMAIDANIIIFERIKEELRAGLPPRDATDEGFGRAFWTIFDANLTTIIVAVVLSQIDSILGSAQTTILKGFGTTLLWGIIISMITALFFCRYLVDLWVNSPRRRVWNIWPVGVRPRFISDKKLVQR